MAFEKPSLQRKFHRRSFLCYDLNGAPTRARISQDDGGTSQAYGNLWEFVQVCGTQQDLFANVAVIVLI